MRTRSLLIVALIVAAAVTLPGCKTNPATGDRIFAVLTWEQEKQMGAEAAFAMGEQFGGAAPSDELQSYTDRVGEDLVQYIEEGIPSLEWEFTLLDSAVINAFALPGGKVFITRGLCERMTNEAQFAAVIGHEIGHVTGRHGNQRISQQMGLSGAVTLGAIAVGMAEPDSDIARYGSVGVPALAMGGQLAVLSYGRGQELEADMLGARYMARAGYDPLGARQVQEILLEASGRVRPSLIEGLQASHPYPQDRIDAIDDLLQGEYAYTQNNPDYQLYDVRWQRSFLSRLNTLPPPPEPAQSSSGERDRSLMLASSWCLHCATASE